MTKRDFNKEYKEYHASPEQKKRRAARNQARRVAERKGLVSKGDGKELDHLDHSNRRGKLDNSKVRVVAKKTNRSKQPKRDGSED